MAKIEYTKEQTRIIHDSLELYKDELKKLLKKADKLGLKEAESIKQKFLEVESLRNKIQGE